MKKEKKAKEIERLASCLALSVRMVVTLKHFTFPPLVICTTPPPTHTHSPIMLLPALFMLQKRQEDQIR